MTTSSWALSGDLARPYVVVACVLAAIGIALLVVELARARRPRAAATRIVATGALAALGLLAAVLRPVAIQSRGTLVGPRVVALVDGSRSMDLPGLSGTRRATAERALRDLMKREDARVTALRFGEGAPVPLEAASTPDGADDAHGAPSPAASADPMAGDGGAPRAEGAASDGARPPPSLAGRPLSRSDLVAALEAVAGAADERPAAIVVLSDGRLDRPGETGTAEATREALGALDVPVHTVALATDTPRDASIRAVKVAGAAVAHQALSLRIEVACEGGLACDELPVAARELHETGAAGTLASGIAHVENGRATIDLSVTLDRAGARILEVEIQAPKGDTIPDNDKRYVPIHVARDRVRVLHVAGRPTYDVRALRMWLKADASVDVIAFFILRTPRDDVLASQNELALIPFPVDELFREHLPSFDAVVLQDFNAEPYGLERHLPALARYVQKGGGLIMAGGPDAFVGGHYAGTPLAEVLPVELERGHGAVAADLAAFVPRFTEAGRAAPVLAPLRELIGENLPEMPGTNIVGDARPGATVLLEHPTRTTASNRPMPVLALGEYGSGRSIALSIDGSHKLLFSNFAASNAGRAHGAFWDALLGWLMRDPRFEPAVIDVPGGCIAGEETWLSLRPIPGAKGEATITVKRLGSAQVVAQATARLEAGAMPARVPIGRLDPGGYSAEVEVGTGDEGGPAKAPATTRDFACERGGDEWADVRPDVARLETVAKATGGRAVLAHDIASLPLPEATQVTTERRVQPLLPPWAWTLVAATFMGIHWIVRRKDGLS